VLTAEIEFVDEGFDKLMSNLEIINLFDILIGYIEKDGEETHINSEISVAQIATMMEYGTENIEARSFIRSTMIEKQSEIFGYLETAVGEIIFKDKPPLDAFEQAAISIVNLVGQKMDSANSWAKPLEEETIEEKASNTVLKDTGQLRRNLGWAVTKKNQIVRSGRAS